MLSVSQKQNFFKRCTDLKRKGSIHLNSDELHFPASVTFHIYLYQQKAFISLTLKEK